MTNPKKVGGARELGVSGALACMVCLGMGLGAACLASIGEITACLFLAAGASIALLKLAAGYGVVSLPVLFVVFHGLYGLSGPISVNAGQPLNPIFSTPYALTPFMIAYSLATSALGVGMFMARPGGPSSSRPQVGRPIGPAALFAWAAAASGMQVINFARAGGIPLLFGGKTAAQSLTNDLVLTLPASHFAIAAMALTGWSLRFAPPGPMRRWCVSAALAGIAPLLASAIILGQRGLILDWLCAGLLGLRLGLPSRFRAGGLVLVTVGYVALGLVYANRAFVGAALATGDWSDVLSRGLAEDRLIEAINPAANEFGTPLGNFGEFVGAGISEHRWGETYVRAVLLPIPTRLYPGDKPVQIGMDFRDRFFPELALEGSIAGTAYSSLLEAYDNFGVIGSVVVYFLLGLVLGWLGLLATRSLNVGTLVFCAVLSSGLISFHRSDFADSLLINAVFGVILMVVARRLVEHRPVAPVIGHASNGMTVTNPWEL